ncbi:MAG: hypothetical protein JWP07_3609 [Pseudonocardiales bacterium]|nr:hypothetical protein [Pseudonocardiales bacterium]
MSDVPAESTIIEGHVVHTKSNALQITFRDGTGDPFAVGVQGAGDGKGKRLGVLFGFKNAALRRRAGGWTLALAIDAGMN